MASSSSQQRPWASPVNVGNFVPTKLWFNYTSTNYPAWKEQMLCLIQSQGLLGFIDGTIAPPHETVSDAADATAAAVRNPDYDLWSRSDVLLKGWILCSLNDDIVYTVSALKTSRDVWLELENKFRRLFNLAPPPPTATSTSTTTGGSAETTKVETQQNTGEKDLKEYLHLHRAALQGNWEAAKRIFDDDPCATTASINLIKATALHVAVGTGKAIHFVEKLVAAMPEESISVMDDIGGTPLSVAAAVGNVAAATIIVNRMPTSLYVPNDFGNFPLQIAALYAQKDMLKYLISITKDDCDLNPYAGLAGLRLLVYVIDAEFFEIALYLVKKYPDLARLKLPDNTSALKKITAKKSVFVSEQRFNFWQRCISYCVSMETISRPQFTKGCDIESMAQNSQTVFQSLQGMLLNVVDGLGAIKSIKEKTLLKQQALEVVKCLCKEIELLSFMEAKDIYFDAIMVAAQLGIHEVVEEIVGTFPSAIYCLTPGSNQYIFHVAVENRSKHVYNLIYQMSDHKHLYSDLQDSNGNNLLHLAGKLAPPHKLNEISGAALQMQHEIQWYKEVENFVHPHSRERLNYAGKSPKMVFTEEHKILKEEGEKWMKDTSNSCTIAAALIATVMFAAAITVPGGNDSSNGFPIFSGNSAFIMFAISDAVSLFTSATSLLMFLAILTSRYAEEDFLYVLPKRLIIGLGTLFLSITFMMVAFSATLYLVFGRKESWVLIPVGVLACLPVTSFVLLQFPLLVDLVYSTYGPGIFGKQSNRPFH
ncbi:uncharacterized protein LOC105161921 isoform X1 [Sesamum indicum]|uniref:Uncharacterized protein LOC105161921 isoform X1 n=1 Tax=Sesamum indicum TaxID=4182 RepID=A0A6I9TBR1_SESIN|nr:uncharacterized protein LOC105161921 isoform X1 [Sesamum indicum]